MTTHHPDHSHLAAEVASQPDRWAQVIDRVAAVAPAMPTPGERVAVLGCGSSLYGSQVYAARREGVGQGLTDAYPASEHHLARGYDRAVVITRSGTTTEALAALQDAHALGVRTTAIVATARTPATELADDVVLLPELDERSVVQSRFATGTVALLRAGLGDDLSAALAQARALLAAPVEQTLAGLLDVEQVTFVGRGWTIGLAHEAALKLRESARFWTESYPAMEYRHGPVSIATTGRAVWALGEVPAGLAEQVRATGAHFEHRDVDPLVEVVRVHLLCLALAARAGIDPDRPRHLARSIVLDPAGTLV
jgi:fructoselysine-6-P-deglycase FrlB-like protein